MPNRTKLSSTPSDSGVLDLEEQKRQIQKQIDQSGVVLEEMEKKLLSFSDLSEKIEKCKLELVELEKDRNTLIKANTEYSSTVSELVNKQKQVTTEFSDNIIDLAEIKQEIQHAKNEALQLEKQINNLKVNKENEEKIVSNMESIIISSTKKLDTLIDQKDKVEKELMDLAERVATQKNEIYSLITEKEVLVSDINNKHTELSKLSGDIVSMHEEMDKKKKDLENVLIIRMAEVEGNLAKKEAELNDKEADITRREQILGIKTDELRKIKTELEVYYNRTIKINI